MPAIHREPNRIPNARNLLPLVNSMRLFALQNPIGIELGKLAILKTALRIRNVKHAFGMIEHSPSLPAPFRALYAHGTESLQITRNDIIYDSMLVTLLGKHRKHPLPFCSLLFISF